MSIPDRVKAVSPVITSAELERRLRTGPAPRMVDVREVDEFVAGHIPGAVNLPLSCFQSLFRSLSPHEELVLVCRSGNRSGTAQQFLRTQGFTQTRNLVDGMLGWTGAAARGK
ncbi:MAG TPA: rhodanese-like domain-containing protein [Symbiobacteriaceae bacterium]|jgi:rhodanese-related sulfurtransferase